MMNIEIKTPDSQAMERAGQHWNSVAKPLGSLGKLEELLIQIAGIQRTDRICLDKKAVLTYCADNGVVTEGVSQSDSAITAMVARSMAQGRANINVMAASVGADVCQIDVGMKEDVSYPNLLCKKIAHGTANLATEPAMTRMQCETAIQVGIDMVRQKAAEGYHILAVGEMGIGNTTTSSAVASALLGRSPKELTGRGAGLTAEMLQHKIKVIEQALALHHPNPEDAADVLCKVGGFDLAAMAGTCIGGMYCDMPIVLDGFISAVAALAAVRMVPACRSYLLPSHVSREPAAAAVLEAMDMHAILHADMCLGEGTGAVLLFPLLDAALAEYRRAHTFGEIELTPYEELT